MTGARCSVAACGNYGVKTKNDEKTKHIRYHRFPKDPERIMLWMDRCHREKKINPANSFICSEHFTENDYERDLQSELLGLEKKKRLKKTAVPNKLLTAKDIDDFLEEQVNKKLNAPYIPPEKKGIQIENVFSMNMHDLPTSPQSIIKESENENKGNNSLVFSNQEHNLKLENQENNPLPLANQMNKLLPFTSNEHGPIPVVLMLPYKPLLDKQTQTIDIPVLNVPKVKPTEPISNFQNNSNTNNYTCKNENKCDILNLKLNKINEKNNLLLKRYSNLRHILLKNKLKIKDMKREKAMNVLSIKRLSREIKLMNSEKSKRDERKTNCEAALKSVFSENQIKLLMGKKKVAWSSEDLSKAFTLLYYSKKTYLLLKNIFGMPLPSLSTLKRAAARYNYQGKELESDEAE